MNTVQSVLVKDTTEGDGLSAEAHPKHKRVKEMQRELDRMRFDFAVIANAFHEVRTPLHSMGGFIELMLDGRVPDPEVQREFLTLIDEQSQHLSNLVIAILDIAAIKSGQMVFQRQPVSMKEVIDKVTIKVQKLAEEKEVAIETIVFQGLPDIEGDFEKLERVVANLLGTAINFSLAEGKVFVVTRALNDGVLVQIIGQSTDIFADGIPRLFQKSSQVDIPLTPDNGTAWLGLQLAKEIIEAHGGQL